MKSDRRLLATEWGKGERIVVGIGKNDIFESKFWK